MREIEAPDPMRLAECVEVARRWLPAFAAGRRGPEDVYAETVTTWHNVGEWEAPIKRTPSRRRRIEAGARLELRDLRCRVFDGGFVVQATSAGTAPDGTEVSVPTCLVVTVVDGRITRFEEYADSRAAEALFGGPARSEHDSIPDS